MWQMGSKSSDRNIGQLPMDAPTPVGVQRQYSGTLGKNRQLPARVSVNAVTQDASCPLDWRLFVPVGCQKVGRGR
jgi:SRSO17 transposase